MWWESQQPPGPTVVVILLPRHLRSLSDGWALAFPGLGDCRAGARGHHFGQVTRNVALVACLSQFFVRDYVNMCGVFGIIICESLFNLCVCVCSIVLYDIVCYYGIYHIVLYCIQKLLLGCPSWPGKKTISPEFWGCNFMICYCMCFV